MNIEEANDNLIMLKYFLQEEGDENWEKYCEAIETLLTAYEEKEERCNFLDKELYNANQEIQKLQINIQKEKEKNKEIEADLTSVWIDGVEDGKKYLKDKIKAKIGIRKDEKEICKDSIEEKYLLREIYVLESLLEKE